MFEYGLLQSLRPISMLVLNTLFPKFRDETGPRPLLERCATTWQLIRALQTLPLRWLSYRSLQSPELRTHTGHLAGETPAELLVGLHLQED